MPLEVSNRQSRFPFSATAPILFACGSIQAQLTLKGRHEAKQGAHQEPNPPSKAGALLAGPQIFARSRLFERYSPLY